MHEKHEPVLKHVSTSTDRTKYWWQEQYWVTESIVRPAVTSTGPGFVLQLLSIPYICHYLLQCIILLTLLNLYEIMGVGIISYNPFMSKSDVISTEFTVRYIPPTAYDKATYHRYAVYKEQTWYGERCSGKYNSLCTQKGLNSFHLYSSNLNSKLHNSYKMNDIELKLL